MALSHDEILAGLAEIIHEETSLPVESVQLDKSFADDLDIDSIAILTIMINAEAKFGVKISDEDAAELKTVGDVVNFIAAGA
jgi:acyl carrier protein